MSLPVGAADRIKQIRCRDELLACGYVKSNALVDIPFAIIQICIAFFMCIEEWDINTKGQWLEITGDYNQICKCTNPDDEPGENYQTILGTLSLSTGKHHWRFKITNMDLTKKVYVRFLVCLWEMMLLWCGAVSVGVYGK